MHTRLLVGPAQWWDRAVIVGSWISVDLALRAGVQLPVLARIAHVSLDSEAVVPSDGPPASAPEAGEPEVVIQLSPSERHRLRVIDVVANRWPFGKGQCLRRALVTGRVLRRLHPRLSLGVARRQGNGLAAHAWLELDGGTRLGYSDEYERLSPMGQ
jgi:hypothetical protein